MVKLTADLIQSADAFINCVDDRELNLRGRRIPAIENLGATKNQFDLINLADNEIRVLGNIPQLPRLKGLLLAGNRIATIEEGLEVSVPELTSLILTNNQVSELGDLDALAPLTQLTHLSLLGNPVARNPDYRAYAIFRIPSLRVLDFERVRDAERKAARAMFTAEDGSANDRAKLHASSRSMDVDAEPSGAVPAVPAAKSMATAGMSPEETAKIMEAIRNATSLDEIQRLEEQLARGKVPANSRRS
ncbi:U2 snRNP complex subunit [Blastocladiella emersonii ATCC 22665]|nr:U2 snRNP complex subunit [Blastocladiella emersonii ATCC 22665]